MIFRNSIHVLYFNRGAHVLSTRDEAMKQRGARLGDYYCWVLGLRGLLFKNICEELVSSQRRFGYVLGFNGRLRELRLATASYLSALIPLGILDLVLLGCLKERSQSVIS